MTRDDGKAFGEGSWLERNLRGVARRESMEAEKRCQQAELQVQQRQHHQGVMTDICGEMGRPGIGHNGAPPIETWGDSPICATLPPPRDTRPARCVQGL